MVLAFVESKIVLQQACCTKVSKNGNTRGCILQRRYALYVGETTQSGASPKVQAVAIVVVYTIQEFRREVIICYGACRFGKGAVDHPESWTQMASTPFDSEARVIVSAYSRIRKWDGANIVAISIMASYRKVKPNGSASPLWAIGQGYHRFVTIGF